MAISQYFFVPLHIKTHQHGKEDIIHQSGNHTVRTR